MEEQCKPLNQLLTALVVCNKADLSLGFYARSRNIASAFAEIGSSGIGSISIISAVKASRGEDWENPLTQITGFRPITY